MKKCPICKVRFQPSRDWQVYDRVACRREAHSRRVRECIRAELLKELAAR